MLPSTVLDVLNGKKTLKNCTLAPERHYVDFRRKGRTNNRWYWLDWPCIGVKCLLTLQCLFSNQQKLITWYPHFEKIFLNVNNIIGPVVKNINSELFFINNQILGYLNHFDILMKNFKFLREEEK